MSHRNPISLASKSVIGPAFICLALTVNGLAQGSAGKTDADLVFIETSETESATSDVVEVSYSDSDMASGFADYGSQLSQLQAQVARQQNQLDQLRKHGKIAVRSADRQGRLFATYESVLVQPTQSNPTAVIVEVESNDGFSHIAFPWTIEHSPRIQFGRESEGEALGWRFRFWEFRHTDGFSANGDNGLIPTGNEGTAGFFIENGDILTGLAFINEGEFTSHVRTDVIDWELQRRIAAPIDLYAGLRYAKIAQGYRASTDEGTIAGDSEFRGIGPTLALRFTHVLPLNKLQLFANLRGSMLFGSKDFTASDSSGPFGNIRQTIGDIDLRSGDDSADSFVTNAEIQMGLRYAICSYFAMSVAIEGQHYGEVGGPNPSGVFTGTDGGLNGDSPMDDNLAFLGLTVGTEFLW